MKSLKSNYNYFREDIFRAQQPSSSYILYKYTIALNLLFICVNSLTSQAWSKSFWTSGDQTSLSQKQILPDSLAKNHFYGSLLVWIYSNLSRFLIFVSSTTVDMFYLIEFTFHCCFFLYHFTIFSTMIPTLLNVVLVLLTQFLMSSVLTVLLMWLFSVLF